METYDMGRAMRKPPHEIPGVLLRLSRRERLIAEALWTYFVRVHARPLSPGLLRGIVLGEMAALARLGWLDQEVGALLPGGGLTHDGLTALPAGGGKRDV